jgi:hypothetical protein
MLTMACFQLFFGKLYVELPVKWVYLSAIAIFEIGSIVCAAAPNSGGLIAGRAVAGLGATGLLSGGFIVCVLDYSRSLSIFDLVFLFGCFTDEIEFETDCSLHGAPASAACIYRDAWRGPRYRPVDCANPWR